MEQSRILVVDDDKEIREIIRVLLTQEGYDVSEARRSGISAFTFHGNT